MAQLFSIDNKSLKLKHSPSNELFTELTCGNKNNKIAFEKNAMPPH
jgi:hypothetical protein